MLLLKDPEEQLISKDPCPEELLLKNPEEQLLSKDPENIKNEKNPKT